MPAVTGLLAGCDALLRVAGGAPLGPPVEPWEPDGDSDQNPWASALEWACAAAEGSADQDHAARAITEAVNAGGYFHYDDEYGAPHYSEPGSVYLSAALQRFLRQVRYAPSVNCQDCASFVVSFANLLGCELYSSRMGPAYDGLLPVSFGFALNAHIPIGHLTWDTENDMFRFHEVAWTGACMDNDLVYDACLELDDHGSPYEEPRFPVLPMGMIFSDGSTNSPYAYRERLARPGLVGYDRCLARPETRKRRRVE